jgi:hypothetical protein
MKHEAWLWLLVLAGPVAWAIDFNVSYAMTPPAHEHGSVTSLLVMHGVAFVVALVAGVASVLELRATAERPKFMAAIAAGLSLISMLLVIGNAIPTLMLTPGAEP